MQFQILQNFSSKYYRRLFSIADLHLGKQLIVFLSEDSFQSISCLIASLYQWAQKQSE